jgi:hypothetical protein
MFCARDTSEAYGGYKRFDFAIFRSCGEQAEVRVGRTISQSNHPHIGTVYVVGSLDGIEFLVMECVDANAKRLRLL